MSARWTKIAVIMLLAFAAVDLFVPGLCIAEAPKQASLSSSAGSPLDSGVGDIDIDDCFCCCAHIVPEHLQAWDNVAEEVAPVAQSAPRLPLARVTRLERPPRA